MKDNNIVEKEEIQDYRIKQLECNEKNNHQEVMMALNEIKIEQQKNNNILIRHDERITNLEKKFKKQDQYIYALFYIVLASVVGVVALIFQHFLRF
jgi:uncharacterized coiled-coil protein SlyX